MGSDDSLVLCGGIFFALLLTARPSRTTIKEPRYRKNDGLSEPAVLTALVRVMYPEFRVPKTGFKTNASEFKSCKINAGNLPFFRREIEAFDTRVRNDYPTALAHMTELVEQCVEVGGSVGRDRLLVAALLDLIEQDKTIPDTDLFYIAENGHPVTKAQMRKMTSFCLPAFLLGIWHYIVVNRHEQNTLGRATFDKLCPPNNGKPRVYEGDLGEHFDRKIKLTMPNLEASEPGATTHDGEEIIEAEIVDDDPGADDLSESSQASHSQVPPPVFISYGANATQIHNVGVLTINQGGR